jgi:protease IV
MVTLPGGSTAPILLELDLTQPMVEVEPEDPIAKLRSRNRPRLRKVLRTLYEAGADPRVGGLIARVGGSWMPLATAQEIRAAVRTFAASGKPTVAWADTFGESANGTVPYFLATGFGEIWLQQSADVGLIGVSTEVTFLRGALDKLGVEPQLDKRGEFKNAADRITRTEFTPEHHEATDRVAASAWDTVVDAVADARGLTGDQVRELADRAPLSVPQAIEAGLVDHCGYRDEVYAEVRRRLDGDVRLLFASRWSPPVPAPKRIAEVLLSSRRPVIGLVEAQGTIVTGRSRRSPVDGRQLGSDTLSAALRAARADDKVRAVVMRVDSPGGSYVASDTVWREVSLTREAGKPVVVSMGTLAGSGGYFIACPADVIVAESATLTGSIGVFGGKAVVSGLLDKVGLSTGAVAHGARARMFSPRVGFSDDERARMSEWLDAVYDDFVGKVADGRGMSREQVHQVARGRVWSGADAATNGLVDVVGGMHEAADIAREQAGLPSSAALRPAIRIPPIARLQTPRSSEDPRAASMSLGGWGEFTSVAAMLGLPPGGPLLMPPIRLA